MLLMFIFDSTIEVDDRLLLLIFCLGLFIILFLLKKCRSALQLLRNANVTFLLLLPIIYPHILNYPTNLKVGNLFYTPHKTGIQLNVLLYN